jgi:hypothetical protein
MRLTAKSTLLTAVAMGLGLSLVEPALAQVQSAGPILYRDKLGHLHTAAGGHRRHLYGTGVNQLDFGVGNYQPYYPHHFHGGNYGNYPLVPFDYPNIVPQYSR